MSGASNVHALLFEGLMRLEPDGTISYAQAHAHEISEDQKTYTFYLRDSFWSDETEVTAYDFEKTWKNILDPQFPALDAHVLYSVKNASAAKKGELSLDEVGIYAKDRKTLIVELKHPSAHFLHLVASSILFPINQTQEYVFPDWHLNAGDHFVCNGPFKLIEWKHHDHMFLEKNEHYRLADKIKFDAVYISIINNGIAALHIHASGLFDIIRLPLSPLPFDLYRELIQKNLFHIVNMPGTMVCMFNTKKFPFHNVNMRKAFSYAIDRQFLIDTITLLKEEPAFGLVPPLLKKGKKRGFFTDCNLSEARACFQKGLKELGAEEDDLEGKIFFSFWKHDHGCPLLPQALQQQWQDHLGVKVETEALDFQTLHDKGRTGQFSMGYFVLLSNQNVDSMELLDRFKFSHNARNYARWQNNQYTDFLEGAAQALKEEERFDLLERAEKILIDEMPISPVFHWNNALLVQPYIKGVKVSPLGYLCFDHISIEKGNSEKF